MLQNIVRSKGGLKSKKHYNDCMTMIRATCFIIFLAAMPSISWANDYLVEIKDKFGESVGTTCGSENQCPIDLLLYSDSSTRIILTTSVQFIDMNVFITFKIGEKYLYASSDRYNAVKHYAALKLNKHGRLYTKIFLFQDKPKMDDEIILTTGSDE